MSFSVSWLLHARGFFKDHLNAILQSHPLERLLPLQVILLVNLVQVLDFLAPLVLFFKVAEIALDLLFSLLHASSDFSCLLSCLFLLHLLDLCEALLRSHLITTINLRLY